MRKRNIQIVMDMSMSMKYTACLVYAFLYQFLQLVMNENGLAVTLQLVWFSGDKCDMVIFENEKHYTESFDEFMGAMKGLRLRKGARSNAKTVRRALEISERRRWGEPGEQVLMYFTDYYMRELMDMSLSDGINRVFLFVPEGQGNFYRFRIVNKSNFTQKLMPTLVWSLDTLQGEFSESDCDCMLNYLV